MAMMQRPRPEASIPAPASVAGGYAADIAESPATAKPLEAATAPVEASVASMATTVPEAMPAATTTRQATKLTAKERRDVSSLAELYSILVTTEHLENAFVRGAVSNDAYEQNCRQLLTQFKTLQNGLRDKCPDVRVFIREQGLHCPLAEERLLGTGVAATALFGGATATSGKESLACFKASEGFITLLDVVNLSIRGQGGNCAVDELMPIVRDLQASIVAIPSLPKIEQIEKITGWLVTLNSMRASDSLDEGQARQLAMDVELAYNALKTWLEKG